MPADRMSLRPNKCWYCTNLPIALCHTCDAWVCETCYFEYREFALTDVCVHCMPDA